MTTSRVLASGRITANNTQFTPLVRKKAGALWLRGDSLVQSGGLVTGWVDKFGNWPAATLIGANSPNYTAASASYGGRAVANFPDAVVRGLFLSSFVCTQPNTIYLVVDNNASNGGVVDGSGGGREIVYFTTGLVWGMYAGAFLTSAVATAGPHAICGIFNNMTSAIIIDNAQPPVITGSTSNSGWTSGLTIGCQISASNPMKGNIAEILIVPGQDSFTQTKAYFDYVNQYYGLAGVS